MCTIQPHFEEVALVLEKGHWIVAKWNDKRNLRYLHNSCGRPSAFQPRRSYSIRTNFAVTSKKYSFNTFFFNQISKFWKERNVNRKFQLDLATHQDLHETHEHVMSAFVVHWGSRGSDYRRRRVFSALTNHAESFEAITTITECLSPRYSLSLQPVKCVTSTTTCFSQSCKSGLMMFSYNTCVDR